MSSFEGMWARLAPIGRAQSGGYRRFAWTREDGELREWFRGEAADRGMDVVPDRNGNLFAWAGDPDRDGPGLVLGSHLDSVPDGGAFDGPLGIVSAFAALDQLREAGWTASRPVGIACFADEEGARFGVACAGSRLLTGVLDPDRARGLSDAGGIRLSQAMAAAGHDPRKLGRDDEALQRIGAFVELHIEQGRCLGGGSAPVGPAPVGVASGIRPHGRWRLELRGRADHAGTTRLADRDDPMLSLSAVIQAARDAAAMNGVVATVGKVVVSPNAVNAIPSSVIAWLDARGLPEAAVRSVVAEVGASGGVEPVEESWTTATVFDAVLRDRVAAAAGGDDGPAPVLDTAAGHDAGILADSGVPTAMLFVRNPTGVSHSPAEFAEPADCLAGVHALARVMRALA